MKYGFYTIFVLLIYQGVSNQLNVGTDPTDLDGWNRSGLNYYKDHGTGREYISRPFCGDLFERKQE